jgi:hypothetical protein
LKKFQNINKINNFNKKNNYNKDNNNDDVNNINNTITENDHNLKTKTNNNDNNNTSNFDNKTTELIEMSYLDCIDIKKNLIAIKCIFFLFENYIQFVSKNLKNSKKKYCHYCVNFNTEIYENNKNNIINNIINNYNVLEKKLKEKFTGNVFVNNIYLKNLFFNGFFEQKNFLFCINKNTILSNEKNSSNNNNFNFNIHDDNVEKNENKKIGNLCHNCSNNLNKLNKSNLNINNNNNITILQYYKNNIKKNFKIENIFELILLLKNCFLSIKNIFDCLNLFVDNKENAVDFFKNLINEMFEDLIIAWQISFNFYYYYYYYY